MDMSVVGEAMPDNWIQTRILRFNQDLGYPYKCPIRLGFIIL